MHDKHKEVIGVRVAHSIHFCTVLFVFLRLSHVFCIKSDIYLINYLCDVTQCTLLSKRLVLSAKYVLKVFFCTFLSTKALLCLWKRHFTMLSVA